MKNRFLTFSAYRAVLFIGLAGVLAFLGVFGPALLRFYFSDGRAFYYEAGNLAVHYLDVGQGECIIIQLPDGKVIVMDSGEEMYYTRVSNYLKARVLGGGDRIDYLIATHSHSDHIGGFAKMIDEFDVGVIYRPYNKSDSDPAGDTAFGPLPQTEVYNSFISAVYNSDAEVRFVTAGVEIFADFGGERLYSFYFHMPTPEYIVGLSDSRFDDFNEISPIITLRYFDHVFIFTADAGIKAEKQFVENAAANGLNFTADSKTYLKVGHHGSRTGTTALFLEYVLPDKAIISLGARNTYNFPHKEVIARLQSVGLKSGDIIKTSEFGNIAVVVDGFNENIYFAFDNEADLRFLLILGFVTAFIVSFVDFRKKYDTGKN